MRKSPSTLLVAALFALGLLGCELPEEKNLKKGKLLALASEPYAPLLAKQAEEFHRLYPETGVTVKSTTTREAVVAMFNDTVRVICIDRQLNEEERRAAQAAEIGVVETKIAEDALAVLVHQQNPMKHATLASLKDIVSGATTSWSEVPESKWSGGRIAVALTGRNSGTYEILTQRFLKLTSDPAVTHIAETSRGVLEYVDAHPQALGIVSAVTLQDSLPNVRVLSLEAADSIAAGRPFVMLHQTNIYRGFYPWRYALYMYRLEQFTGIALGFTAFVAGAPGQKLLSEAKLVPAHMNIRIVQIKKEN
jgi:phosphate transport system substrate-binding protein